MYETLLAINVIQVRGSCDNHWRVMVESVHAWKDCSRPVSEELTW